ncbi:DUF2502 domain-containing protein [Dickeya zeae]|jgi:hypothetical protein|uniref:DUF2502 domain-containing protein n=1 Tax=Dickeya zeae TaxID=204042 RepID=UPI000D752A68|nr:DUF2502 domain-containing protein [Dickeya zeae]PXW46104.1 uncharacterized protein DUF2502 [Erwinia sp. AG740]UJR64552.1 DUF2502 domain-containing protein [Dickeya zeae]
MIKPLLLSAIVTGLLLSAMPAAQADSLSLSLPGVSLHIGDRDTRGYYWDGNRWCDPDSWYARRHHHARQVYYEYYDYAPPPPPRRVVVVEAPPPPPVYVVPAGPRGPGWGWGPGPHHGGPRW